MAEVPDSSYAANLWEHPDLCVGIFGMQVQTEDGWSALRGIGDS